MNVNGNLQVLPQKTRAVLSLLRQNKALKNFYLAGGTGLALQIKHRISADLDFFSKKEFSETSLIKKLKTSGRFELQKKSEQTIIGSLNGIRTSFLYYPYTLLQPLKKMEKIEVASLTDIGCMKLDALSSRGTKRDFIDVYFIAKNILPLKTLLRRFKKKYSSVHYNLMHVKKSLVYFNEAEDEPMPKMLIQTSWKEVKGFFREEIKSI